MPSKIFKIATANGYEQVPDFPGWVIMGLDEPIQPGDVFVRPFDHKKNHPEIGDLAVQSNYGAIPAKKYNIDEFSGWCMYRPIVGVTGKHWRLTGNPVYSEPLPLP